MSRLVASFACAVWFFAASPALADPSDFVVRVIVEDADGARQISGVIGPNGQVLTSAAGLITSDASDVRVASGAQSLPVQNITRQGALAVLRVAGLSGGAAIAAQQDAATDSRVRIFWASATGIESRQEFVTSAAPRWDGVPGSALGGAIVNECDQIVGIVAPRGNTRAVERGTAQGSPGPMGVQTIARSSLGLLPRAETPCAGPAAADADSDDAAAVDDAARQNEEANQEVAQLEAQLAEAEQRGSAQAQRLRRELEDARTRQAETAAALERAQADAEGAGDLAQREREQKERVSQLARYGAIGGLLLIVIVGAISALLLMRARRRTGDAERDRDHLAEKDRRRANAPDWVLVGEKTRLKLRGALMADENRGAIVGRGQSEADVLVESESISRRHARFVLRAGGIFVEDLGSMNGTTVNGRRLAANESTEVREGDRIEFAAKSYTLQRA